MLKCTKFYFGWGSAPDPAGGARALSQLKTPLLDLRDPTSKGGGREEKRGRGGGTRRGRRKGMGRKGEELGVMDFREVVKSRPHGHF